MTDRIKVGFVGCGGIAREHMKGLAKNEYAELTAFCDINIVKAEAAAKEYGTVDAKFYSDAEEMFRDASLDAVYFCLPPFAHGAEFKAIERDIPFFVEKPVNLYLDQAKRIAEAVERKNLITSVGYMNRYRRGVQMVRDLLMEDPPILLLGGWITKTPSQQSNGIFTWWIIKEKSGGQFHEQVTHTVDLARFLCGEIVEVHAYPAEGINRNVPSGYNIEDASVVNVKFEGGAVGTIWASCSANAGGGGISLSVYAESVTALFTGWEHSLKLLRKGKQPENIPGEEDIFSIEDAVFIDAVKSGDPSKIMSPYSDGLKTAEVTLAANESMRTGKAVRIRGNH